MPISSPASVSNKLNASFLSSCIGFDCLPSYIPKDPLIMHSCKIEKKEEQKKNEMCKLIALSRKLQQGGLDSYMLTSQINQKVENLDIGKKKIWHFTSASDIAAVHGIGMVMLPYGTTCGLFIPHIVRKRKDSNAPRISDQLNSVPQRKKMPSTLISAV
eukprot:9378484-Ditylum_brightwellii.AAC.1